MNCGVYCRISTDQNKQKFSLQTQREKGTEFCLSNNYTGVYYEEEESGSSIDKRPEFSRLIEDIETNHIQIVWVVEFSRLTRDDDDSAFLRRLFVEYKVRLFTLDTEVSFDSPEDLLFYNIRTAVSSYERRKLKERLKRSLVKRKDEGLKTHYRMYGYDFNDGIISINDEEATTVKYIYNMFINGVSYKNMGKNLIMEGHKRKNGSDTWSDSMVRAILKKPEYIGKTYNTKGQLIESKKFESIMDEDLWNRAQDKLNNNIKRKNKNIRIREYELSGLIKCEKCNGGFYARSTTKKYVNRPKKTFFYYRHRNINKAMYECDVKRTLLNLSLIDDLVRTLYIRAFDNPDQVVLLLKHEKNRLLSGNKEVNRQIENINNRIDSLEVKKKKYISGIINDLWSEEDVRDDLKKIKDESDELHFKLSTLLLDEETESYDSLINSFSRNDFDNFTAMSKSERKSLYTTRINYIKMNESIMKIQFITGRTYQIDVDNVPEYWKELMDFYNPMFPDYE